MDESRLQMGSSLCATVVGFMCFPATLCCSWCVRLQRRRAGLPFSSALCRARGRYRTHWHSRDVAAPGSRWSQTKSERQPRHASAGTSVQLVPLIHISRFAAGPPFSVPAGNDMLTCGRAGQSSRTAASTRRRRPSQASTSPTASGATSTVAGCANRPTTSRGSRCALLGSHGSAFAGARRERQPADGQRRARVRCLPPNPARAPPPR